MSTIDYKDFVETCPDIIWQIDTEGYITYINQAIETLLGYRPEEIIGTKIPPHIPLEEHETFKKISYYLRKVAPRSFEGIIHPRRHKDGRIFLFEMKGAPFYDHDGNLLGYRGVSRKVSQPQSPEKVITDRLLSEHILLESIINTLPIRIFWKDRYFRYIGANRLFLQDLGVNQLKEIIGKDDFTLLKSENAEQFRKGDLKTLHTGQAIHAKEELLYTHTGKKMWVSLYKTPLKDQTGEIFGILGAYIDITQLKQQEIELKEQTYHLKEAQRMAKMGCWDFNILQKRLQWCAETYRIFGYPPSNQTIPFETFLNHLIPGDRKKLLQTIEETLRKRELTFNQTYTIVKKDGTKAILHTHARVIYDAENQPIWMRGMVQDMTESYRLQKENETKQRLLMHQTRLAQMGQLLNNIAHQWKQPLAELNALLLDMDTDFRHGTLQQERFHKYFEQFETITAFMGNTIESFQAYMTPSQNLELIDPTKILDEALLLLRSRIHKMDVDISVQQHHTLQIIGTQQDMLHIFLVLLNNALDAFELRSTVNPMIKISFQSSGDDNREQCIILFEDNAGGIAPDIATQIFTPYFTTKFKEKGRGIGLYMAKMIVENRMQGSLKLTDAHRSLFQIILKGIV